MPTVLRVCSEPPEVRPAPVRAGGLGRLCARLVRMRTAILVLRLSLTCGACGAGSSGFSRPAPVLMDSAASPWSPTLFTWTPPARETGAWARRGRVSVVLSLVSDPPWCFHPPGVSHSLGLPQYLPFWSASPHSSAWAGGPALSL